MVLAVWACAFACGIAVAILGQAQVVAGFALAALGLAAWSLRRRAWVSAVAAATLAAGVGLGIRAIGSAKLRRPCPRTRWFAYWARWSQVRKRRRGGRQQEDALLVGGSFGRGIFVGSQSPRDGGGGRARPGTRDDVALSARLFLPRGFANPGLPDACLLSKAQGVDLLASVRHVADIQMVSGLDGWNLQPRRLAFRLRSAMARVINQRLTGAAAAFVRTMVLGRAHRRIARC